MRIRNVIDLGVKELRALGRDAVMMGLIVWAFSFSIYAAATAMPDTLHKAPVSVVDLDRSALSLRIVSGLRDPLFLPARDITAEEMDARMDAGLDTFSLVIPPGFQRDAQAGRTPELQLNVDATRVAQAFVGAGYIQSIALEESAAWLSGDLSAEDGPVALQMRARFNPSLRQTWFSALMELINNTTVLAIVLTGAALIREREHGTVEHLLAMPVTPAEIMLSKVLSMGLVVLVAAALSLTFVLRGALEVQVAGSAALFLAGAALHILVSGAMGVMLGTAARSMPQFGLLFMMVVLPMQMLSGGMTPFESMPPEVQVIMSLTPNAHFVAFGQAVLMRGAGLSTVWPQLAALAGLGAGLFALALMRFRASMAGGG